MSKIWYENPANIWEEALPLGNGRLGAMVYGRVKEEQIQVNEESIWYGGPVDRNNPSMKEQLPVIRGLLFDGKIAQAEGMLYSAMSGCPQGQHPYQTLGDLHIGFQVPDEITSYKRELDLETAVARVTFAADGVNYERDYFISKPADTMVMRFTADRPGSISFWAGMDRGRYFDGVCQSGEGELCLFGNLGRGGYEFAMKLRAVCKGGTMQLMGERILVDQADEVLLFFTADTTYQHDKEEKEAFLQEYLKESVMPADVMRYEQMSSFERQEWLMQQGLQALLRSHMDKLLYIAGMQCYEELKECHVEDYQEFYKRLDFAVEDGEDHGKNPTDKRLAEYQENGKDISFAKLYFDFGRYLLIACSREGGLPATLQGLWNKDMLPPWESKYTININTEMNYWPAENCNLSECHMPLFELMKRMVKNGRKTAQVMYGCRGIVAHHNTDINGDTAPQDMWIPGSYWVMGMAWLCTHQWTHYQYTKDQKFLQEAFPIMCEAALFFLDFLVEKDGYLVTCPSVSPENTYILPSGEMGANGIGVTMDNQILRDLFNQCIEAGRELSEAGGLSEEVQKALETAGIDDVAAFLEQIAVTKDRLIPTRISERGTIMEWQEDYKEWEPGHRHISHLYGLHPSEQITMDGTPELAKAARETLAHRLANGGGHTGWSRAWIINHYAKLWDGESAYNHLEQLFIHSTYPNLFDKHPPFQIDGNFGAAAAVVEMLVQSSAERCVLLPALPAKWQKGHICGVRIKGNASMDLYWAEGCLVRCIIKAYSDLDITLRYKDSLLPVSMKAGESKTVEGSAF